MTHEHERQIETARMHMTVLAANLSNLIGPIDAAGVLMGAAAGVLTTAFGDEKAVEYLRELADEIEADHGGNVAGHA